MLSEPIIYDRHDAEYERYLCDPQQAAIAQTWLRSDNMDHWRHERMHRLLLPFIETDPAARWLTVGDGRYGSEARFLKLHGRSVHASDGTPQLLQVAAERGLIDEFSRQNAENLTFDDASFDYAYCKESLHHFPRPFIALHEMFRVASKAVILQELHEKVGLSKIYSRWLGRLHSFETVGNYMFRLTRQDCEKFLLAMHYRHCAFRSINDHYFAGVEFCPTTGGTLPQRFQRLNLMSRIALRNVMAGLGIMHPALLTAVLFKSEPATPLRSAISAAGYRVIDLPKNPYLAQ